MIDGWKNKRPDAGAGAEGEAAVFGNGKGGKLYKAYQDG
jgi:DNA helicase-2/ATP-dependent DNA helicase PcrA